MASLRQLFSSASKTSHLVVAGLGALAAAATQSLPVLAIGALAYGALVAIDAMSSRGREEESRLPEPRKVTDEAARRAVEAMLAARRELDDVLQRSPDSVRRYSGMALASVPELEEHAAQLVRRACELGGFLDTVRIEAVQRERDELRRKAAAAHDAQARSQFEEAASSCDARLRTLRELVEARERLEGHLSRLVATYQSLPSRIVHLRTLDAQAADSMSGTVNQELDRMNSEMGAFEQSLKELSARVPA
jgi:chromosome segregation ATPase